MSNLPPIRSQNFNYSEIVSNSKPEPTRQRGKKIIRETNRFPQPTKNNEQKA